MKKTFFIIFIALCIGLCMIPSVCMIFARSDEAIGNEVQKEMPRFSNKDGSFNENVLKDAGDYFETHYAFRPQLITADALIQANVFKVSNTDTVTVGNDGWLYYSSTINDYLGAETLSERGMFNLAHNILLMQRYVESRGARFLFMVPANKNTLYGENMPYYYSQEVSDTHNRDSLKRVLSDAGVNYLDLFELFEKENEVLYLKQDSHWNNKGALMVYNAVMDTLEMNHETYEKVSVSRAKIHEGDLSAMIYPASSEKEYDFRYDHAPEYEYIPSAGKDVSEVSVEDSQIDTVCEGRRDTLLMYRDSFGNTLIPFVANEFASAHFSKLTPYLLSRDMDSYQSDVVIVEKVERNLADFVKNPAMFPALVTDIEEEQLISITGGGEYMIGEAYNDSSFIQISGTVPADDVGPSGSIYIKVTNARGEENIYETFAICTEDTDYGFLAYLPMGQFGTADAAREGFGGIYTEK